MPAGRLTSDLQTTLTLAGDSINTTPVSLGHNQCVLFVATGAARTVNLPTAEMAMGRTILVKDTTGTAGANNITIQTDGAETIDGAATCVIATNYGYAILLSDGTNWYKGPCLLV